MATFQNSLKILIGDQTFGIQFTMHTHCTLSDFELYILLYSVKNLQNCSLSIMQYVVFAALLLNRGCHTTG